jgi:hypothetical protein
MFLGNFGGDFNETKVREILVSRTFVFFVFSFFFLFFCGFVAVNGEVEVFV